MIINKVIISLLHKVQCHSLILKMNMENSKRKISLIGKSKTCRRMLITMIGIILSVSAYSGNPFLPGNFADPCIITYKDTFTYMQLRVLMQPCGILRILRIGS